MDYEIMKPAPMHRGVVELERQSALSIKATKDALQGAIKSYREGCTPEIHPTVLLPSALAAINRLEYLVEVLDSIKKEYYSNKSNLEVELKNVLKGESCFDEQSVLDAVLKLKRQRDKAKDEAKAVKKALVMLIQDSKDFPNIYT
jgi:hypothetical protein